VQSFRFDEFGNSQEQEQVPREIFFSAKETISMHYFKNKALPWEFLTTKIAFALLLTTGYFI
jgi:hypothetical protein